MLAITYPSTIGYRLLSWSTTKCLHSWKNINSITTGSTHFVSKDQKQITFVSTEKFHIMLRITARRSIKCGMFSTFFIQYPLELIHHVQQLSLQQTHICGGEWSLHFISFSECWCNIRNDVHNNTTSSMTSVLNIHPYT